MKNMLCFLFWPVFKPPNHTSGCVDSYISVSAVRKWDTEKWKHGSCILILPSKYGKVKLIWQMWTTALDGMKHYWHGTFSHKRTIVHPFVHSGPGYYRHWLQDLLAFVAGTVPYALE